MNVKLVLAFFLPKARYFLQKFTASKNSLRMLFVNDACRQLHQIFFIQFGDNIQTSRQLRNAVFVRFFDKVVVVVN